MYQSLCQQNPSLSNPFIQTAEDINTIFHITCDPKLILSIRKLIFLSNNLALTFIYNVMSATCYNFFPWISELFLTTQKAILVNFTGWQSHYSDYSDITWMQQWMGGVMFLSVLQFISFLLFILLNFCVIYFEKL